VQFCTRVAPETMPASAAAPTAPAPAAPVPASVPAPAKRAVAKSQTVIAVIDETDAVYETTQDKIARFKQLCASKPDGAKLLHTLGLGPEGAKCSSTRK
jgi:hypothetical protein